MTFFDPAQHGDRSPKKQVLRNEAAYEVIFTVGGLAGAFAWGFFMGQILIGWWAI